LRILNRLIITSCCLTIIVFYSRQKNFCLRLNHILFKFILLLNINRLHLNITMISLENSFIILRGWNDWNNFLTLILGWTGIWLLRQCIIWQQRILTLILDCIWLLRQCIIWQQRILYRIILYIWLSQSRSRIRWIIAWICIIFR